MFQGDPRARPPRDEVKNHESDTFDVNPRPRPPRWRSHSYEERPRRERYEERYDEERQAEEICQKPQIVEIFCVFMVEILWLETRLRP